VALFMNDGAPAHRDAVCLTRLAVLRCVPALLLAGCATPYSYAFHLANKSAHQAVNPTVRDYVEDADLRAEVAVKTGAYQSIELALTNKTDQVLQVKWDEAVLLQPDGGRYSPRPQTDLGWIKPGATQTAQLVPFVLPAGDAAAAYDGKVFRLELPMIIRREAKLHHYTLSAHVQKKK